MGEGSLRARIAVIDGDAERLALVLDLLARAGHVAIGGPSAAIVIDLVELGFTDVVLIGDGEDAASTTSRIAARMGDHAPPCVLVRTAAPASCPNAVPSDGIAIVSPYALGAMLETIETAVRPQRRRAITEPVMFVAYDFASMPAA